MNDRRRINPSALRRIFAHLAPHLQPHRRTLLAAAGCMLGVTAMELLRPWPIKFVFDAILIPGGRPYELAFEAVPAAGISPEALAERIAGEQASPKRVEQLAERLTTMAALHEWLFTEHAAYAAHLQPRRETGPKLDTY